MMSKIKNKSDSDSEYIRANCIPQEDIDCYYNGKNKNKSDSFGLVEKLSDKKISGIISDILNHADKNDTDIIAVHIKKVFNIFNTNSELEINTKKEAEQKYVFNIFNEINKINGVEDLANLIKYLCKLNIFPFFSLGVFPNIVEPDVYCLYLSSPNFFYDDSLEFFSVIKIFFKYYTKIYPNKNISLGNYYNSIISLSETYNKFNDETDVDTTDTYSNEKFIAMFQCKQFWKIFFEKDFPKKFSVISENYRILLYLDNLLNNFDNCIGVIKNYLSYCFILNFCEYLDMDSNIVSQYFGHNKKKLCVKSIKMLFGNYIENIYTKKNYSCNKNNTIYFIFNKLKDKLVASLKKCKLNNRTKDILIKKIKKMKIIVGKQNNYIDISNIFDSNVDYCYYEYNEIINSHINKIMFSLLGNPVDKSNDRDLQINNSIYSFEVNAYYDPLLNLIYLPTALIEYPFIDDNYDITTLFGTIGCIIAHEIVHSLDDEGRKYNDKGHKVNFWDETDIASLNKEICKIISHYGSIRYAGRNVNPEISLTENIADILGIKLSIKTCIDVVYEDLCKLPIDIDKYGQLENFFRGWSKIMSSDANIGDDELMKEELNENDHMLQNLRVIAPFSHVDEYYNIYSITDDRYINYLAPSKRFYFYGL
jgi:predicted metalloendopeptidase